MMRAYTSTVPDTTGSWFRTAQIAATLALAVAALGGMTGIAEAQARVVVLCQTGTVADADEAKPDVDGVGQDLAGKLGGGGES